MVGAGCAFWETALADRGLELFCFRFLEPVRFHEPRSRADSAGPRAVTAGFSLPQGRILTDGSDAASESPGAAPVTVGGAGGFAVGAGAVPAGEGELCFGRAGGGGGEKGACLASGPRAAPPASGCPLRGAAGDAHGQRVPEAGRSH